MILATSVFDLTGVPWSPYTKAQRIAAKYIPVLFGFMPNEIVPPRLVDGEGQADRQKELTNLASEIRVLKEDVRELSELIRLLAGFVPMPASETEEEKVAIGFETRLAIMLNRHFVGHPMAGHQDAIEGELLISQ